MLSPVRWSWGAFSTLHPHTLTAAGWLPQAHPVMSRWTSGGVSTRKWLSLALSRNALSFKGPATAFCLLRVRTAWPWLGMATNPSTTPTAYRAVAAMSSSKRRLPPPDRRPTTSRRAAVGTPTASSCCCQDDEEEVHERFQSPHVGGHRCVRLNQMPSRPPGWYPDPRDNRRVSYWDGHHWTGGNPARLAMSPAPPSRPAPAVAPRPQAPPMSPRPTPPGPRLHRPPAGSRPRPSVGPVPQAPPMGQRPAPPVDQRPPAPLGGSRPRPAANPLPAKRPEPGAISKMSESN